MRADSLVRLNTYTHHFSPAHAAPLEVENVHLELRTGRVELGSDAIIKECIAADSKIIVRDGASRLQATIDAESGGAGGAGADGMLTCRNAGCQMKFKEEENSDTACCYHSGPPVFHETYKWWSCCPQVRSTSAKLLDAADAGAAARVALPTCSPLPPPAYSTDESHILG